MTEPLSEPLPNGCTIELLDEICTRLSAGETLRKICRDKHLPRAVTIWKWRAKSRYVWDAIARARKSGVDAMGEEMRAAATEVKRGEIVTTTEGPDGTTVKTQVVDMVDRAKLQVQSLQWLMERCDPDQYGRRPDSAVAVQVNVGIGLTDQEREQLVELRRMASERAASQRLIDVEPRQIAGREVTGPTKDSAPGV